MKIFKLILTLLFGALMIYGGVNHFLKPEMYTPFVPNPLPKALINYGSGIVEIVLGIGTFIPRFRQQAAFGIFILMVIFLPLHVTDVFKENPAIGSHQAALVRLPVQLLFIALTWFMSRKEKA